MSDITIFIFGCGVIGVALAATIMASIAGIDANTSETADLDRRTEAKSSPICDANRVEPSLV